MTPYQLHILLDVFVGRPISANPAAPLFEETIAGFVSDGWITSNLYPGFEPKATDKLRAHMEHILSLPHPVCKWVHA